MANNESETVTITGCILDIRFERDGFIIAKFGMDPDRCKVAILGNMINPEPDMQYKLRGRWADPHPVFGSQFRFDWYESVKPQSTDGIYKYLVRIAKWVGPSVGNKLVEQYGVDTLNILKADPQRVASEVKGITLARAREIQDLLRQNELTESAVVELEQIFSGVPSLRKGLAMDCVVRWKADAESVVKVNPYRLMELRGVGFLTADKIAMHMGFDPDGIQREQACVLYIIELTMQTTGSTWIGVNTLGAACKALIDRECSTGLQTMVNNGKFVIVNGMVSTREMNESETSVAQRIIAIQQGGFERVENEDYRALAELAPF